MSKVNLNISEEEIEELISNLDYAKNGKINYTEFLGATIDVKTFLTDEKLDALFSTFDIEGSGKISADNIKVAFTKFGRAVKDEEVDEIMK